LGAGQGSCRVGPNWGSVRCKGRKKHGQKKRGGPLGPPLFHRELKRHGSYEQPVKPPPALSQWQVMPEPLADVEVPVKLTPAASVI